MKADILIIGGGVIGLSLGWKLLQGGRSVTLLERGETGRESSWAAAGMLAPVGELHFQEENILRLGQESMALYPEFVRELEAFTGLGVGYRTQGSLAISLHADDTAELRHRFQHQQEFGLPVQWMTGTEVQRLEPALSPNVVAGVLARQDHSVDNRRFGRALREAFLKAGGMLLEKTPVEELSLREGAPPLVRTQDQSWDSEVVVLSAGAWSGLIPGIEGALRPLVRPVKGQILTIQGTPGLITHTLRTPDVYMVPREDGRILIGATVEEMGFNRESTVGGVYELLRGAWRAIPGLHETALLETGVGFRPGSRDNAPLLGATGIPGFYLATGHYRNGILHTPVTATYLSRLILRQAIPEFFLDYSPARFHSS